MARKRLRFSAPVRLLIFIALIVMPPCLLMGICSCIQYGIDRDRALIEAVHRGDLKDVKCLLDQGLSPTTTKRIFEYFSVMDDLDGPQTALETAAYEGRTDIVKIMLDRGADVNAIDNSGGTALLYAVQKGPSDTTLFLLDHGANPNIGNTPLYYAAQNGSPKMVRALLDHGADAHATWSEWYFPLREAAAHGYIEVEKMLLDHGADVDAKTSNNETALMAAAEQGRLDSVKLLLARGANVNAKTTEGKTAFFFAVAGRHKAVAECLKKAGAKD